MTRTTAGLFLAYTALSVFGLLLLRSHAAPAFTSLRSHDAINRDVGLAALGMLAYTSSFALWLVILARVPLIQAYPTSVGLTLLGTTFASALLLHEAVGPRALMGCLAVFLGVYLLSTA